MKYLKWIIVVFAVVALFTNVPVLATPINFIETSDFSDNLGNPTLITPSLDIGINTISGDTFSSSFFNSDTDVFRVNLPSSQTITNIFIDVTDYSDTVSGPSRFEILFSANGNLGSVFFNGNGTFLLPYTLNDPSNIAFRINAGDDPFSNVTSDSFSYTVSVVAAPVPEPATMFLFGTGLAGLAGTRLRKKKK